MNRITTLLLAAVCTLSAYAQLNGNGYYRAQSSEQGRYIRIIDNRGSVNLSTTEADMEALRTKAGFENVVSDPATIIYIKKMKDYADVSPMEYVMKVRLHRAVELLKDDSVSVQEVAQSVGFNTHSFFSECFKREFGMTPRQWRLRNVAKPTK